MEGLMQIINLTPHDLRVVLPDDSVRVVPRSGTVARVATTRAAGPDVDGIPTVLTAFGDVEGLPAPAADTAYVVSGMVAARCGDRADVFAPGELVRDADGNVVGCRGLSR
jgi:hypothetical protein